MLRWENQYPTAFGGGSSSPQFSFFTSPSGVRSDFGAGFPKNFPVLILDPSLNLETAAGGARGAVRLTEAPGIFYYL